MLLERGITGFFDIDVCPLDQNNYSAFKKACYLIHIGFWELNNVCNPDNTNYFYAHFAFGRQNMYILLNKYYPIVAFTNELTMNEKSFINIEENLYVLANYNMVGAEILNAAFTYSEHNLSKAELKQIKYWKPTSIGNIIFNEWD